MRAFFFGERDKTLFGAYHSPVAPRPSSSGVVICYPFGNEYIKTHRAFRQLARQLSRSGFHVLRFDYFGTGDSHGEGAEGSIGQWLRDISMAISELKDMSLVRRVSLVGFRLGGTLAAVAASGRQDVDGLVLWDPMVNSKKYLRELLGSEGRPLKPSQTFPDSPGEDGVIREVNGFPLTGAMITDMADLSLLAVQGLEVGRCSIIATEGRNEHKVLFRHLQDQGVNVSFSEIDSSVGLNEEGGFSSAVLMPEVQESIMGFMEGHSPD